VARNQISLGIAAVATGDPEGAIPLLEHALAFFRQEGDGFHTAWATGALGHVYLALGRLEDAKSAILETIRLRGDVRNLPVIAASLNEVSGLESSAGRHVEAMRLAGAADAMRDDIGAVPPLPFIALNEVETTARQAIGDEAAERALAEGRRMTVHDAFSYAVSLME
jgi:tetratricopeptide (TPR) repeat protein